MKHWLIIFALCRMMSGQSFPASAWTEVSSHLSGLLVVQITGTCPSGTTEVSALNGKFLQGTIAANGDVGSSGGNATITPTGTVSQPTLTMNAYTPAGSVAAPTFTGSQGTVPAQTFTGSAGTVPAEVFTGSSATTSSVSAGTPAGSNSTVSITPLGSNAGTTSSGNCAATNIAAGTGSTTACKATAPNLTIPAETFTGSSTTVGAETFTGSALAGHTHTLTATGTNGTASFTPAGTNSTAAFTPAGTNSAPAFTGNQATLTGSVSQPTLAVNAFDPRPQFIKVIFCSVN